MHQFCSDAVGNVACYWDIDVLCFPLALDCAGTILCIITNLKFFHLSSRVGTLASQLHWPHGE